MNSTSVAAGVEDGKRGRARAVTIHRACIKLFIAWTLSLILIVPSAGTAQAGGIGSVWAKDVTDDSITWVWNAPTGSYRVQPGANPAYRVCVAKGLGSLDPCLLTTKHNWNQTEYASTELQADRSYRVEVQCMCEKRKKNGNYKNPKWRKIGTLKQSTAKETKGGGGGSELLSVIGASETTLAVRVDYSGSKTFNFLRVCYKRKYNMVNSMLLQCGSLPNPWNASDDMKGWHDWQSPVFPATYTFTGLEPGTKYSLIAYGFEGTSEQIGDRVVARTAGKWKPFRLMREIRDDHADLASEWLQAVEAHYATLPISRSHAAADMHLARAGVRGIPILEWGPNAVHTTTWAADAGDLDWQVGDASLEQSALPEGAAYFVAGNGDLETASPASADAEVYVPATDRWHALAPMAEARRGLSLTRLQDGRILAAGGDGGMGQPFLPYAEIFDPGSGTWRATAPMGLPRTRHTATLLPDGSVLVVGGGTPGFTGNVERFDPQSGSWESVGSLIEPRDRHTATLLPDGSLLVVGGRGTAGRLSSVERFDPATGVSTLVGSLHSPRAFHTASLVTDCCIIIIGGQGGGGDGFPDKAERYMLDGGQIEEIGALGTPRKSHAAVPLADGRILVVGGDRNQLLSSVERFDLWTGEFEVVGDLSGARTDLDAMLGPDGRLLVLGGRGVAGLEAKAERFDSRSATFLHLARSFDVQVPVMEAIGPSLDSAFPAAGSRDDGVRSDHAPRAQAADAIRLEDAWAILAAEEGEDIGEPEALLDFLAETDSPIFEAWQAETGPGSLGEVGLDLRSWLEEHEPALLVITEEEIEEENAVAPTSAKLANISTRAWVGQGDDVMIDGFIVSDGPTDVIIRAIGPDLANRGVPGVLQDPVLRIYDGAGSLLLTCDDWMTCPGAGELGGLAPNDPREAALKMRFDPGAYTAIVSGEAGGTGVALVEVFHAGGVGILSNISTRAKVLTEDRVLIGGLIVRDAPGKVIFRGIGPDLTGRGVPGALEDPWMEIYDGDGKLILTCDDWQDCPGADELGALEPTDPREPATVLLVEPGAYTAIIRGKAGGTGVALVEAFALR